MPRNLTVNITQELESRVRALASQRGEAVDETVQSALLRFLDDEADRVEIETRMERYHSGGKTVAHEDVLMRLKSRAAD